MYVVSFLEKFNNDSHHCAQYLLLTVLYGTVNDILSSDSTRSVEASTTGEGVGEFYMNEDQTDPGRRAGPNYAVT